MKKKRSKMKGFVFLILVLAMTGTAFTAFYVYSGLTESP